MSATEHAAAPAAIHHQGAVKAGAVTVAHDQAMTLHIVTHVPDPSPQEGDPHHPLFKKAEARLKRQGLWKCAIGDELCGGEPELHHTFIEFADPKRIDVEKVAKGLGLHFDNDEQFEDWVQSPGNLEVLCLQHHRAHYGIHVVPGPLWEALRFRKSGTDAAAHLDQDVDSVDEAE